mgnify:CR=1 FL=1
MKKLLAKGGIEFLAVFLGIALSLWVDDYRQEKELNNRIIDDYNNIYSEVLSNIIIIDDVIEKNKGMIDAEERLLKVLNGEVVYNQDNVIQLLGGIYSSTFFGETSAHKTSVASGRFNSSKNDTLTNQISKLYEHYFVRLDNNGLWMDNVNNPAFNLGPVLPFYSAIYNQNNLDSLDIKNDFFSDTFKNSFLYCRFVRGIYFSRLEITREQLYKVKNNLKNYLLLEKKNSRRN